MKGLPALFAKTGAIWLGLTSAAAIGGAIFHTAALKSAHPEPISYELALLAVCAVQAILLAALASQLSGGWRSQFLTLFVTMYGVETVLSLSEAIVFQASVHFPQSFLVSVAVTNLLKSVAGAAIAAALFHKGAEAGPRPLGLFWKLPVITMIYIITYFAAGGLIAWQSQAVREFYGDGLLVPKAGLLALVQAVRGLTWAALAVLLFQTLRAPLALKSILVGLTFALFMAISLVSPNPYMPAVVRTVHFAEVAISNSLFGFACVLILAAGTGRRNRSQQKRAPKPA